jgi:hypothetical protein
VTARTSFARGEGTPGPRQPHGHGGLVKPLLAYALGSLLAASSKKPAQGVGARNVQPDTDRNGSPAAREERPQEMFPAITAIVSLYGFFAQASGINEHVSLIAGVLPGGAVEIIQEQVTRIASKGDTRLTLAFAFGLALALWSANAGMKALIDALNVAYNEEEKRGFIKLNLVSLALSGGAIVAVLIAVGAVVVVPVVLSYLGLGGWLQTLLSLLRWPILLVLMIFGLAVLIGSDRAGSTRAGNGSLSEVWWPRLRGSLARLFCHGIWRASPTMTPPMDPLGRRLA